MLVRHCNPHLLAQHLLDVFNSHCCCCCRCVRMHVFLWLLGKVSKVHLVLSGSWKPRHWQLTNSTAVVPGERTQVHLRPQDLAKWFRAMSHLSLSLCLSKVKAILLQKRPAVKLQQMSTSNMETWWMCHSLTAQRLSGRNQLATAKCRESKRYMQDDAARVCTIMSCPWSDCSCLHMLLNIAWSPCYWHC